MADDRCEYCDTPVSPDTSHCPECGAVLRPSWERNDDATDERDEPTAGTVVDAAATGDETTTDEVEPTDGYETAAEYETTDEPDTTGTTDDSTDRSAVATGGEGESTDDRTPSADPGVLHPEGLLDDTLTVVVGAVGGILIGTLVAFWAGVSLQSAWGLAVGGVAWLGATGYLMTRYRVTTAFAHACYGVALSLVLLPTMVFSPGAGGESGFLGTVVGFLVYEAILGVVGGAVAAVGFAVSRTEGGLTFW